MQRSEGEATPVKEGRAYGCIFCVTGREQEVARRIQSMCPEIRATAVLQEKHKSVNGRKSRIWAVMLPGYVFFEAPDAPATISRIPKRDVIRVLKGNEQGWQLVDRDYEFADWLFSYDGRVGFSTAYHEGDRIHIVSGPLKDMEGWITRIDRRGRSGQVTVRIGGREMKVWLGFDLLETPLNANGRCSSEEEK